MFIGHALCPLLAAPGCSVSVHLGLKGSVCVLHHSCLGLPNSTQPVRFRPSSWFLILTLLGLYNPEIWDSPRAQHTLLVIESTEFDPEKYMDMILTHIVLNNPFDFHASAHTYTDTQYCKSLCSAPYRTEPFTNPSKPESIDFQSNPRGILIYISQTSCLLRLRLLTLVFNQSWFWAMNTIRFSCQETIKVWR